ncbi:MAG: hypothetical protein ACHP79_07555 [Terriglobales bacterium]
MSAMVSVYQRLASAWAVLLGKYGEVTHRAAVRGQSRQSLYREARQVQEAVAGEKACARIEALKRQVAELKTQLLEAQERSQWAVEITRALQKQFADTAQASGVSLSATRQLLAVFLKKRTPSVAKLGRWTQEAGVKAGEVLKVLDALARPCIEQAAADEIFLASGPR